MYFEQRSFWLPKDLGNDSAYQDAYMADPDRGIAAIADGVSSSMFAGSWARILTSDVVADPPDPYDGEAFQTWLKARREKWVEPIDVDNLPWHQKSKLRDGGASTLLWLEMDLPADDHEGPAAVHVRAFALGDCNLFHVRDGVVLRAFPLEQSHLFEADPIVLHSVDKPHDQRLEFLTLDDHWCNGDLVVLCTDAIAAWAIGQLESQGSAEWDEWDRQWEMTAEAWQERVVGLRENQQIRYDDTTVLMLRITAADQSGDHLANVKEDLQQTLDSGRKLVEDAGKLAAEKLGDVTKKLGEMPALKKLFKRDE